MGFVTHSQHQQQIWIYNVKPSCEYDKTRHIWRYVCVQRGDNLEQSVRK